MWLFPIAVILLFSSINAGQSADHFPRDQKPSSRRNEGDASRYGPASFLRFLRHPSGDIYRLFSGIQYF